MAGAKSAGLYFGRLADGVWPQQIIMWDVVGFSLSMGDHLIHSMIFHNPIILTVVVSAGTLLLESK